MSTQTDNNSNAERVQKLPAILLKPDLYSKGRNVRWMDENGYEAMPILQCVWIASSQERNCKILKKDAYAIPFLKSFPKEKVVQVLESAVEIGLLEGDENYYWNSQIVADHESFQTKHRNYKKGYQKRQQNHDESTLNPSKIHGESSVDYIDTDIDYESDTEDLKENSPPLPDDPDLAFAESHLEPISPTIKKFNGFMSAGRRPMKNYPALWLTPFELKDAILQLEREGVPKNELKSVFSFAQAHVAAKPRFDMYPARNCLTGFALQQFLETRKKSNDLKRSETYLNGARK